MKNQHNWVTTQANELSIKSFPQTGRTYVKHGVNLLKMEQARVKMPLAPSKIRTTTLGNRGRYSALWVKVKGFPKDRYSQDVTARVSRRSVFLWIILHEQKDGDCLQKPHVADLKGQLQKLDNFHTLCLSSRVYLSFTYTGFTTYVAVTTEQLAISIFEVHDQMWRRLLCVRFLLITFCVPTAVSVMDVSSARSSFGSLDKEESGSVATAPLTVIAVVCHCKGKCADKNGRKRKGCSFWSAGKFCIALV